MDVIVQQHRQIFHHKEAHQQRPLAMNFRHIALKQWQPCQTKTITKDDINQMKEVQ